VVACLRAGVRSVIDAFDQTPMKATIVHREDWMAALMAARDGHNVLLGALYSALVCTRLADGPGVH
jgi:hypothetical protein